MLANRFMDLSLKLALCGLAISNGACCSTAEYENIGYRRSEFVPPVLTPAMLAQLISGNKTPESTPNTLVQGISLLQRGELQLNSTKAAQEPVVSLRLKREPSVSVVVKYAF